MKKKIFFSFLAGLYFILIVLGAWDYAAFNDNFILKIVSFSSYLVFGLLFAWLVYVVCKFVFGGRPKETFEEILVRNIAEGKIDLKQAEQLRSERKKERLKDLALWDN